MTRIHYAFAVLFALSQTVPAFAQSGSSITAPSNTGAPQKVRVGKPSASRGTMVVNGDISTSLQINGEDVPLQGRVSAYLEMTKGQLDDNRVEVKSFNVVQYHVPQERIMKRKAKGAAAGHMGFAVTKGETPQYLVWDKSSNTLTGTLSGHVDLPQFSEFAVPHKDGDMDVFEAPTQDATLNVSLSLGQLAMTPNQSRIQEHRGQLSLDMGAEYQAAMNVQPYDTHSVGEKLELQFAWFPQIEAAMSLCVQPVRIGSFKYVPYWPYFQTQLSGDGLAFGKPGAIAQWSKADILFDFRDWKTIWNEDYLTLETGEETALRNTVTDSDCIEVFFVDRFNPIRYGGGAAWGRGSSSAQIISTDENADHGIDKTHLAHELGHVLGFGHPGFNDGLTGTLMCGSGFKRDNPEVVSEWIRNNVSNPLLTFRLKFKTPGTDCQGNSDCGACPFG